MDTTLTKAQQREIESRMITLEEDYITARRAVRRESLERGSWVSIDDNIPGDKQIPDSGCWIQIKAPPHCEITCELFSIWYALPVFKEKQWDFMEGSVSNRYRVKVLTPVGEFQLYPSEYSVLSLDSFYNYLGMLGATNDEATEHVVLHWLDPRNEFFDTEKLFYLMSRGIKRVDAYALMLGEIQSPHVCYLTLHEEYQRMYAGVGISSLTARRSLESHIDFTLLEKAAGRWYNKELHEARAAEIATYEANQAEQRALENRQNNAEKKRTKRMEKLFNYTNN